MDEWVSLMPHYSSVDNLETAVSEAHKQLEQSQLQLRSTQQAEASLHSQVASLTTEVEHLRSRLQDPTDTHNDLMNHSMAQFETIGSLRSQLTNKSSTAEPMLRLLRQLLLTLPTDFDDDLTPDDTVYHFLVVEMLTPGQIPNPRRPPRTSSRPLGDFNHINKADTHHSSPPSGLQSLRTGGAASSSEKHSSMPAMYPERTQWVFRAPRPS